ncbi:MAG: glycosyltransferase family 39 protein [Gemmatimonadaceae bacterium]
MTSAAIPRARLQDHTERGEIPHEGTFDGALERPVSRVILACAATLLVVHAVLVWHLRIPGITTGNDDAWYLLLARSLRAGGYEDAFIVGSPAHSQYPPVYPFFLALAGILTGDRLEAILALSAVISALTFVAMFDAVRRLWSPSLALMALALVALNPRLIVGAGQIRSETLFLALTMLSLWALARSPVAERRGLAMGASVAAALTRTVGMTLPIALLLHWAIRRRTRTLVAFAAFSAITAWAWLAWSIWSPDKSVSSSYIVQAARSIDRMGRDGPEWPARTFNAVLTYFSEFIPYSLPLPTISGTIVDNAALVLLAGVLGAVGMIVMWRGWHAAALYVIVTLALLFVWPWRVQRFVEPLLPFMLVALLLGASTIGARRSARWAFVAPLLLTVLIGSTAIARTANLVAERRGCDRSDPGRSPGCFSAEQRGFFALADYVATSTPDSAVFLTPKAATLAYLTDRKVDMVKPVIVADSTRFANYLLAVGITHVVLSNLVITDRKFTRELAGVCQNLELASEFPPSSYLFRVRADSSTARSEAACNAVRAALANW